jgi:hypothetical protein
MREGAEREAEMATKLISAGPTMHGAPIVITLSRAESGEAVNTGNSSSDHRNRDTVLPART